MSKDTGLVQVSTSPNVKVFYAVDGPLDGSKPVIALSNSLAANTHLWDDFTAEFYPKYTILRYDARFHGQSPLSEDEDFDYNSGHSIEDLASDVVKILDHLKIQRLRGFVGLSIGAAVGLVFGVKYPERVDHVLVVGTKAESSPDGNAGHNARIAYGRTNGPLALGKQSISRWFSPDWMVANPAKVAHIEGIVGKQSLEGFEANIAALRGLNLWPYVENIRKKGDGARFLFVAGEWDGTIPQESQELAKKAGSQVIIIPGSGHIVHLQQPQEFSEVVRKVLES